MISDAVVCWIVVVASIVGLLFAAWYRVEVGKIIIEPASQGHSETAALDTKKRQEQHHADIVQNAVHKISNDISVGANSFLFQEYAYMAVFVVVFSIILFVLLGYLHSWKSALFTVIAFVAGSITSIVAGFVGMRIAVFGNSRTAVMAQNPSGWEPSRKDPDGDYGPAYETAFKAGSVMGFSLTAMGLIVLFILVSVVNVFFPEAYADEETTKMMYEAIAGYGLGGSSIALFGRVGGGIYTKAADVGADLCKIEYNMKEDSPQNPAVIADNVGDNVGDIAGMGADLFGSFAESSCAAMVIASQSPELCKYYPAMCLPMLVTGCGILVCFVTSFVATHLWRVHEASDVQKSLKMQLTISTVLMTPVMCMLCWSCLPETFTIAEKTVSNTQVIYCLGSGLWAGLAIGYVTEYYTSHSYGPVREIAESCKTSAASNIIYGLACGYKSVIVPIFCLAATIYVSYSFAGMFGVACAAMGILSTMCTGLTIDAYGPICDNAGGIAEMAGMNSHVRNKTDELDAAGNTTAAIGKGFAIGSAALVSLALFGAFVTTVHLAQVDILQPFQFSGLLIGAMLPYWFSALTMKSVGFAASEMQAEVRRQFDAEPKLQEACRICDRIEDEHERFLALQELNAPDPDYQECIRISTDASLREMIPPGALVMLTPLITGYLFGVEALAGVLAGALVSGVQMAISSSNTGGAWDNAKKYIEAGHLGEAYGKGTKCHHNAVTGDTVGDPLKDTSGPALNILIKLTAIISLVFAPSFPAVGTGGLLTSWMSL